MIQPVKIGRRSVGPGAPFFIIAEAGVNHNGDVKLAHRLVEAAAQSGGDCVKFQMFKAENVVSMNAPKAKYQLHTTDPAESQFDMLKALELPWNAYPDLIKKTEQAGLIFLCTCYSPDEIDYLDSLGMAAFKLASCQIIELPLLAHIAKKKKPIILSTGMANLAEIEDAIRIIRAEGNNQIILLQCTTNYPSPAADANLRVIPALAESFQVPVGYSDHTAGDTTAIASVALGGCAIEKHFTLDRKMAGPDQSSSLDPEGFRAMVKHLRDAEAALGNSVKQPSPSETVNARGMRRSLVAAVSIPAGTRIQPDMLAMKRPNTGLPPSFFSQLVGSTSINDIPKDAPLQLDMFAFDGVAAVSK